MCLSFAIQTLVKKLVRDIQQIWIQICYPHLRTVGI